VTDLFYLKSIDSGFNDTASLKDEQTHSGQSLNV